MNLLPPPAETYSSASGHPGRLWRPGDGGAAGNLPVQWTERNQPSLPLGLRPCLESSFPLSNPSLWGLLTQSSVQVLEDAAAVVQGDIDPILQERGHRAAAGTGPGTGQGSIISTVGSLPFHLCHFLSHICFAQSHQASWETWEGQPVAKLLGSTGLVAPFTENQGLSELEGI